MHCDRVSFLHNIHQLQIRWVVRFGVFVLACVYSLFLSLFKLFFVFSLLSLSLCLVFNLYTMPDYDPNRHTQEKYSAFCCLVYGWCCSNWHNRMCCEVNKARYPGSLNFKIVNLNNSNKNTKQYEKFIKKRTKSEKWELCEAALSPNFKV